MTDLLDLAIKGHGGQRRWEQIEKFRVTTSITGAIWTPKSQQGPGRRPGCPRARPGAAGAIVNITHGRRPGLGRRDTAR